MESKVSAASIKERKAFAACIKGQLPRLKIALDGLSLEQIESMKYSNEYSKTNLEETSLFGIACFYNNKNIIEFLYEIIIRKNQSYIDKPNKLGATPIGLVCLNEDIKNIRLLKDMGADLSIYSSKSTDTKVAPIFIALRNHKYKIACVLITMTKNVIYTSVNINGKINLIHPIIYMLYWGFTSKCIINFRKTLQTMINIRCIFKLSFNIKKSEIIIYKMNDDIWSIIKEYLGIISKEQFDIIMEFHSELPGVIEYLCDIEERRI